MAGGRLDRLVTGPGGEAPLRARADQQITELAMHDWDLAKATGQPAKLDPALAEHALRWSRGMLRPEFRGPDKAFGVEVPVPDDAPAYDRLAGWFGRDPGWTPAERAGYRIAPSRSARAVAREGPYQVSRRPETRTTRWAGNSSGPSSGVNG